MKKRNVAFVYFASIFSGGLYLIYWLLENSAECSAFDKNGFSDVRKTMIKFAVFLCTALAAFGLAFSQIADDLNTRAGNIVFALSMAIFMVAAIYGFIIILKSFYSLVLRVNSLRALRGIDNQHSAGLYTFLILIYNIGLVLAQKDINELADADMPGSARARSQTEEDESAQDRQRIKKYMVCLISALVLFCAGLTAEAIIVLPARDHISIGEIRRGKLDNALLDIDLADGCSHVSEFSCPAAGSYGIWIDQDISYSGGVAPRLRMAISNEDGEICRLDLSCEETSSSYQSVSSSINGENSRKMLGKLTTANLPRQGRYKIEVESLLPSKSRIRKLRLLIK